MTRTNSSTHRTSRAARAGAWTALAFALLAGTASSTAGVLASSAALQAPTQVEGTLGNGWGG